MPVHLTKDDAEILILNIEKSGGDASALKHALRKTQDSQASKGAKISDEEYIQLLREQSPITTTQGLECVLCHGATEFLISGVCESCFRTWALSTKK